MIYSAVTPYLLPSGTWKKVNVGDGFILDSCIKLLGHKPKYTFSSRITLNNNDIDKINETQFVILAGANTLKDDFEITPLFDLNTLEKIKIPVIPFGIGHYGVENVTRGLTPSSISLLKEIHERIHYSSVRCDASLRYILESIPSLEKKVLMTSCPVVFPCEGINDNFQKKSIYEQLVVTVTDRTHLEQQASIIHVASKLFKAKKKILAYHQNYNNIQLDNFAINLGFNIFKSEKYEDFIELYKSTDIHFGNRVHAHLKCLSMGKISYLCPYDLRQVYFAESLHFPLISQENINYLENISFTETEKRLAEIKPTMNKFINGIKSLL